MKWIDIKERKPTEKDTVGNGRLCIIDKDGYMGHALLAGPKEDQFIISDFSVKYWLEGVPQSPIKE